MDDIARKQIAEILHFYANAHFKNLRFFLSYTALLWVGLAYFGDKPFAKTIGVLDVIPTIGMLVTAIYWIMHIRSQQYWHTHHRVAPDLWLRPLPDRWRYFTTTTTIFLLYAVIYLLWFSLGIRLATFFAVPLTLGVAGPLIAIFGWKFCVTGGKRVAAQAPTT